MPILRTLTLATMMTAAAASAPSIAGAQQPVACTADSVGATPDSAPAGSPAVPSDTAEEAPPVPKNLAALLSRGSTRTAGSMRRPVVYEPAYPKGPLTLRRSSRPVFTQRAGLAHTTGWVQVSPKSSRWVYVPIPAEPRQSCP
jgi:hypothetical protein